MFVQSLNKYTLTHPTLSPEAYSSHAYAPDFVRALYVPALPSADPYIITEKPDNVLDLVFGSQDYSVLFPTLYYHVVYPLLHQLAAKSPNYIATMLIRAAYLAITGIAVVDAIYGDVVIFGSYNYKENDIDDSHYSVPYEVVEQVFRIHDLKKYT